MRIFGQVLLVAKQKASYLSSYLSILFSIIAQLIFGPNAHFAYAAKVPISLTNKKASYMP
jgi:hypothetical protein